MTISPNVPSRSALVAARWNDLEARLPQKVGALKIDRPSQERLLVAATRAPTKAKQILWLRKAAEALSAQVMASAACRHGCSHCCHIAVTMTKAEATVIAREIDRPLNERAGQVLSASAPLPTPSDFSARWQGVPCTFLHEGRCTIYAQRPLACRLQFNMDDDAFLCELHGDEVVEVPHLNTLPHQLVAASALGLDQPLADIREWFSAF